MHPRHITRQSQSLFEDSLDHLAVRIEKTSSRYNGAVDVEQKAGKKNVDYQTDLNETLINATCRTTMESVNSSDSCDKPDIATVTTVEKKIVHPASGQGPPNQYSP